MGLRKKANLIIYRFRERGLEVFLLNREDDNWNLPNGPMNFPGPDDRMIELDSVESGGEKEEAVAVEGDWHEIPSLKAMLIEDAQALKGKLKEIESGTFLTIKDAFKKVLPHQYSFLKELKEILTDRNSLRDL